MRHLGCNQSCHVYVIIGHRGAGKTTWAESVCRFFKKKKQARLIFGYRSGIGEKNKSKH